VLENDEKVPVLIYDIQKNPISDEIFSIDFYRIRAGEKIETEVPIKFVGSAPAEKSDLVIVKVLNEVEIKTLPKDIPHDIRVDLGVLQKEGDAIHVKDLKLPEGIETLTPPETVVVNVSEKKEETEEVPPSVEKAETDKESEKVSDSAAEKKTETETEQKENPEKTKE